MPRLLGLPQPFRSGIRVPRAALLLSGLLLATASLSSASGAVYDVVSIGSLGGGAATPTGINASGQLVGFGTTTSGQTHAFLYSAGSITDLGTLGGNYSYAFGINDHGQVVGEARTSSGVTHAFLFAGGPLSDLGTLGGSGLNSAATAINNAGLIAGYSQTGSGSPNQAFAYTSGSMTSLGMLGGFGFSNAYGINESGQIVGHSNGDAFQYSSGLMISLGSTTTNAFGINESGQVAGYTSAGPDHAFLRSGSTLFDLGTLGGTNSYARGLNDIGQVVGYSQISGGQNRAFLFSGGVMLDLNSLVDSGFEIRDAFGINNAGQIAAFGIDTATGREVGLLLTPTPTPEPASAIVWTLGTIALASGAARRRNR